MAENKEMRTLNGYEVVDAKARSDVDALKEKIGELSDDDGQVTEDIEFEYDGDDTNPDYVWVTNNGGNKIFVRVGDLPDGKINLIGGSAYVTVPSQPYLDYYVNVTDETLEKGVTVNGVEIHAVVNGLTQILHQSLETQDIVDVPVVIVCTRPGLYDIVFNGWMEQINFAEKGVYFADNRPYGGNKYTASFACTVTKSTDGSDASPVEYGGNEMQVFCRGICIGDSITEGVFNNSDGESVIRKYSYPSILERLTGVEIVNAGIAGLTSKTWYEASLYSGTKYGRWVNNEWVWSENPKVDETDIVSKTLDYSGYDFAVIHLGINDIGMMGDATIEDTIAIFETNIHNIVNKLKTESAGIKVFLCTIIPCYAVPGNTHYEMLNDKIREIAAAADDVYLVDLNVYSELVDGTPYENQHLTAIGYHRMAFEIMSLINYTISTNLEEFKTVQFSASAVPRTDTEGVYELIDTVYVTEDVAELDYNAEPDGTPYDFDRVFLKLHTTSEQPAQTWLFYRTADLSRAASVYTMNGAANSYAAAEARKENGYWTAVWHNWRTVVSTYGASYPTGHDNAMKNDCLRDNVKTIKHIRMSGTVKAGLTVEIWAVRAK